MAGARVSMQLGSDDGSGGEPTAEKVMAKLRHLCATFNIIMVDHMQVQRLGCCSFCPYPGPHVSFCCSVLIFVWRAGRRPAAGGHHDLRPVPADAGRASGVPADVSGARSSRS